MKGTGNPEKTEETLASICSSPVMTLAHHLFRVSPKVSWIRAIAPLEKPH